MWFDEYGDDFWPTTRNTPPYFPMIDSSAENFDRAGVEYRSPVDDGKKIDPAKILMGDFPVPPPMQGKIPKFVRDPVLNRIYAVGRLLGKGGFAWCYQVKDMRDGSIYALKLMPKSKMVKPDHREKVLREISIHQPLKHEHIVRLYSAFEDEDFIYMVLEYCANESLVQYLKKCRVIGETKARNYLQQIVSGVRYLHEEARILHRDLKLGNLLLTKDMKIKIADFGLAIEMDTPDMECLKQICGTPNYIAPEVLEKQGHSVFSESWSLGCILYAMLFGKPPFETKSLAETYSRIAHGCFSFHTATQWISPSARMLIQDLLDPTPHCRPKPSQMFMHEFFTEYAPANTVHEFSLIDRWQDDVAAPSSNGYLGVYTPFVQSNYKKSNSPVVSAETASHRIDRDRANYDPKECWPIVIPAAARSTSTSPDSGCHSVICAVNTSGNGNFGSMSEAMLDLCMRDYYTKLLAALGKSSGKASQEAFAIGQNSLIYITKWIDYSNRYGFGCQYNNGGVSVLETSGIRLCLTPDRRFCRRWHPSKSDWSSELHIVTPNNFDRLGDSGVMLSHFVRYMDSNLVTGGISEAPIAYMSSAVPFIMTWRRFPDCIMVVLSDGTFQVNFLEQHTKIVLSPGPDQSFEPMLTYISDTRIARTYFLNSNVGSAVESCVLERVKQILAAYLSTPVNSCQSAI